MFLRFAAFNLTICVGLVPNTLGATGLATKAEPMLAKMLIAESDRITFIVSTEYDK